MEGSMIPKSEMSYEDVQKAIHEANQKWPSNAKMTEELKARIEKEAFEYAGNHRIESFLQSAYKGYIAGATKYAKEVEIIRKIIARELIEIPKLQDFASGSGDAEGYARLCGQLTLLERLGAALNSKSK